MKNSNKKKAYLSAFLYALIIGFSFLFVKLALTVTNPLNALAHRFTIAFIVASIPIIFRWIKLNITLKDLLPILPISIFYPTLFFTFQTFGLVHISSSEAGIIQATVPIFTMVIASIFLNEKSSKKQKMSLLLSVAGVIYIFFMKGIDLKSTNIIGTILILLCALSSASYNVIARKVTKKYSVIDLTYIMTLIGFISFNSLSLIDYAVKGNLNLYFKPFTSTTFIISILYLGILSSVISSLLSNYTLSQIEASKMSVFNNLSTLITMITGFIFLNEDLYYYHIIGAIMIVLGLLGTNFLDKKS
jgi:drug/metabolite transporter (DMT)-like permease